jgi:uncharacterized protein (DUF433 family)
MQRTTIEHIVAVPGVRGGVPHIAGTRMAVSDIALLHLKLGKSVAEIAAEYDLSLGSVHAALAYYFDHQADIDARLAEDEAYIAAFAQSTPSELQAKLDRLRGE